jgi:hypothetical protein
MQVKPLITPTPIILDHSFPRSDNELRTVAVALGEIIECIKKEEADLLLTDLLCMPCSDDFIGWQHYSKNMPLLLDVRKAICQWFLKPHSGLVKIDTSAISCDQPHPIPQSCNQCQVLDFWSDELGKVLHLHDLRQRTGYHIGIACESAFSGGELGRYQGQPSGRYFPLVGPEDIQRLEKAYEWNVDCNIHRQHVRIREFEKNYILLGGIEIISSSSGSHDRVQFKNGASWTLDRNYDPILDQYLSQVENITGYPLNVIKHVLINGVMPDKLLKITV